jgi:hypothetical protein
LRSVQVFANLAPDAMQLQMVSVASVLEAMGYEMKVRGSTDLFLNVLPIND